MTEEEKIICKQFLNDADKTHSCNEYRLLMALLEQEPTTKNDLALIHTGGLDEGIRCAMCTNSIKSDRGCDGGCVVNNAMYKKVMDVIENHIVDTNKMIEPTTKNDLGVDCIDRAELLKAMDTWDKFGDDPNKGLIPLKTPTLQDRYVPYVKYDDMINCVKGMPPVTPQEPRWIHVSERLPEELWGVLVYCPTNDNIFCAYLEKGVWKIFSPEALEEIKEIVTAWMPLPKAYREVKE